MFSPFADDLLIQQIIMGDGMFNLMLAAGLVMVCLSGQAPGQETDSSLQHQFADCVHAHVVLVDTLVVRSASARIASFLSRLRSVKDESIVAVCLSYEQCWL